MSFERSSHRWRLSRSTSAPAGRPMSRQGTNCAPPRSPIWNGVASSTPIAISGSASVVTASPARLRDAALQNFKKSLCRRRASGIARPRHSNTVTTVTHQRGQVFGFRKRTRRRLFSSAEVGTHRMCSGRSCSGSSRLLSSCGLSSWSCSPLASRCCQDVQERPTRLAQRSGRTRRSSSTGSSPRWRNPPPIRTSRHCSARGRPPRGRRSARS